jgi:hypothetical protein
MRSGPKGCRRLLKLPPPEAAGRTIRLNFPVPLRLVPVHDKPGSSDLPLPGRMRDGAGQDPGVPMSMSAGMSKGAPASRTSVPKTTAGVSPAPRAVWTTSSS